MPLGHWFSYIQAEKKNNKGDDICYLKENKCRNLLFLLCKSQLLGLFVHLAFEHLTFYNILFCIISNTDCSLKQEYFYALYMRIEC